LDRSRLDQLTRLRRRHRRLQPPHRPALPRMPRHLLRKYPISRSAKFLPQNKSHPGHLMRTLPRPRPPTRRSRARPRLFATNSERRERTFRLAHNHQSRRTNSRPTNRSLLPMPRRNRRRPRPSLHLHPRPTAQQIHRSPKARSQRPRRRPRQSSRPTATQPLLPKIPNDLHHLPRRPRHRTTRCHLLHQMSPMPQTPRLRRIPKARPQNRRQLHRLPHASPTIPIHRLHHRQIPSQRPNPHPPNQTLPSPLIIRSVLALNPADTTKLSSRPEHSAPSAECAVEGAWQDRRATTITVTITEAACSDLCVLALFHPGRKMCHPDRSDPTLFLPRALCASGHVAEGPAFLRSPRFGTHSNLRPKTCHPDRSIPRPLRNAQWRDRGEIDPNHNRCDHHRSRMLLNFCVLAITPPRNKKPSSLLP